MIRPETVFFVFAILFLFLAALSVDWRKIDNGKPNPGVALGALLTMIFFILIIWALLALISWFSVALSWLLLFILLFLFLFCSWGERPCHRRRKKCGCDRERSSSSSKSSDSGRSRDRESDSRYSRSISYGSSSFD